MRLPVSPAVRQLRGLVPNAFPLVEAPSLGRGQTKPRRPDRARFGDGIGHHAVADLAAIVILPSAQDMGRLTPTGVGLLFRHGYNSSRPRLPFSAPKGQSGALEEPK